jgi:hypothetical protein
MMNKIQLIILRAKVKLGKTKGNSVKDVTFQQLMSDSAQQHVTF